MPFLNLDFDYFDHPKTTRLIGLLGHGSEILPIRLWTYLAKFHASDGRLLGYSPDAIEQAIRWRGKQGKGLEGLLAVGYIEKCEGGYQAHDWDDHQGHIHALKLRNKKVARNRWKNMKKSGSTVDTSGIPEQNPGVPHSLPFQSVPIREKQASGLKRSDRTVVAFDSGGCGGKNGTGNEVSCPQNKNHFLDRVVEFADDEGSRAFFQKAIKKLGEGLVEEAMGETKMREANGSVNSRSPYFTALLGNWMVGRS